jgi:surfactin synthase thioesterase subunit
MVAFPQAGGGCSVFAQHARAMPDWLELMTLNLPGRQARFGESLLTDIDVLTAELTAYWAQREGPFLFFGYCSGALLAYCVARDLQERMAVMPRALVVGSYKAPHLSTEAPLAEEDSEALWKVLAKNHAVPPQLSREPDLWALAEPAIRADMALVAGYRHISSPPLQIPIAAIVGSEDDWLSDAAETWAPYTAQGFSIRRLQAGHWFMEEAPQASVTALVAEAAAVCP